MTKPLSRREIEQRRKNRMARANRLLGWVTLSAFLLPRLHPVLSARGILTLSADTVTGLRTSFIFFVFLHSIAGVYLYGLPVFKWHLRVVQMYLGFVVFGVFFLNRAFAFVPVLAMITDWLLWLPIVLHVGLGLRYLVHRWVRPGTYTAVSYYLGGAIVRDFDG
jgi:succinate dehydrogenase/fumarate reductase cytochrome b subunit